jgi:hypothetical protein
VSFDNLASDAAVREQQCGGQPIEAATNNQDGSIGVRHNYFRRINDQTQGVKVMRTRLDLNLLALLSR